MFIEDILCCSKSCVFDIHLNEDLTKSIMKLPICFDSTIHFWRFLDFTPTVQFEFRINTTYVFATHEGNTRNGGSNCEMLPVFSSNLSRTQRTGEDRQAHLHFLIPSILYLRVNFGEDCRIRAGFHSLGETLGSNGVPLNIEV